MARGYTPYTKTVLKASGSPDLSTVTEVNSTLTGSGKSSKKRTPGLKNVVNKLANVEELHEESTNNTPSSQLLIEKDPRPVNHAIPAWQAADTARLRPETPEALQRRIMEGKVIGSPKTPNNSSESELSEPEIENKKTRGKNQNTLRAKKQTKKDLKQVGSPDSFKTAEENQDNVNQDLDESDDQSIIDKNRSKKGENQFKRPVRVPCYMQQQHNQSLPLEKTVNQNTRANKTMEEEPKKKFFKSRNHSDEDSQSQDDPNKSQCSLDVSTYDFEAYEENQDVTPAKGKRKRAPAKRKQKAPVTRSRQKPKTSTQDEITEIEIAESPPKETRKEERKKEDKMKTKSGSRSDEKISKQANSIISGFTAKSNEIVSDNAISNDDGPPRPGSLRKRRKVSYKESSESELSSEEEEEVEEPPKKKNKVQDVSRTQKEIFKEPPQLKNKEIDKSKRESRQVKSKNSDKSKVVIEDVEPKKTKKHYPQGIFSETDASKLGSATEVSWLLSTSKKQLPKGNKKYEIKRHHRHRHGVEDTSEYSTDYDTEPRKTQHPPKKHPESEKHHRQTTLTEKFDQNANHKSRHADADKKREKTKNRRSDSDVSDKSQRRHRHSHSEDASDRDARDARRNHRHTSHRSKSSPNGGRDDKKARHREKRQRYIEDVDEENIRPGHRTPTRKDRRKHKNNHRPSPEEVYRTPPEELTPVTQIAAKKMRLRDHDDSIEIMRKDVSHSERSTPNFMASPVIVTTRSSQSSEAEDDKDDVPDVPTETPNPFATWSAMIERKISSAFSDIDIPKINFDDDNEEYEFETLQTQVEMPAFTPNILKPIPSSEEVNKSQHIAKRKLHMMDLENRSVSASSGDEEDDADERDEVADIETINISMKPTKFTTEPVLEKKSEMETSLEMTPGMPKFDDLNMNLNLSGFGLPSLIQSFGAEIRQNWIERQKQLNLLGQTAVNNTQKQVSKIWRNQKQIRDNILQEFQNFLTEEINKLERDVKITIEAEETTMNLFKQQLKVLQNCRIAQLNRIRKFKAKQGEFAATSENVDKSQIQDQGAVKVTLKKQMSQLQQKILLQSQHRELMNIKRSLQVMIN